MEGEVGGGRVLLRHNTFVFLLVLTISHIFTTFVFATRSSAILEAFYFRRGGGRIINLTVSYSSLQDV